jgi:hypothetical protein
VRGLGLAIAARVIRAHGRQHRGHSGRARTRRYDDPAGRSTGSLNRRTRSRSSCRRPWKKCSAPVITSSDGGRGAKLRTNPRTASTSTSSSPIALHDQPRCRGRHEPCEIPAPDRRCDRDQQAGRGRLRRPQRNERPEREAGDPGRGTRPALPTPVDELHCIGGLAAPFVVRTRRGTDATKIEAQRRYAEFLPASRQGVHDLVRHAAAEQRMRMTDDAERRRLACSRRLFEQRLDGAGPAGKLQGRRSRGTKRHRSAVTVSCGRCRPSSRTTLARAV